MASDDPEFERKAVDIIGLYLYPQYAAVFCVDGKSPFKRRIDSIRCCRCHRGEPNAIACNTTATAHCPFTPLWRSEAARSMAKRQPGTPAMNS